MAPLRLRVEGRTFRDEESREVTLRGINVAGDAKFPASPDVPSNQSEHFFEGDNVSFVGRPFAVEDAHTHFARLKRWGYNTIRYVFTWEAIEHAGPGKYDEEWCQHTIKILRLAKEYGFYIFMDPHQDVWSRFTGGSGAPLWTLYAVGLNPRGFLATQAAWVHNTYPDPAKYPKMIWATNYTRMACQVMFTLFFAGRDFAPKAILDGKNIQDYLQDHFIEACRHLALRIQEAGDIENDTVIGWESMNEPNRGLCGWQDISAIPAEQKLQKGPSPTAWQAILTASGRPCEMDTWDFGGLGPYKSGTELVDPKGETAWLPTDYDDSYYGWKRGPDWKLGECIWAQHGVWDPSTDQLLKNDYFARYAKTGEKITYEVFTNNYFMAYYRRHQKAIRSVHSDAILFCQPPVLEVPPTLKGTADDDPNMVFAPHYYDGVTLMMKKWNRYWNVDVFGLMRGKYMSPAFAIKIGETAIRNCFRDQLSAIRKEGTDYMGNHPCVFTEIGIPYDMDDKYAYTTGDFSSQSSAMDANHFAIEGSGANGFTLWVYVITNNHEWGDLWNGEDLSIYSQDNRPLPLHPRPNADVSAYPSSVSVDQNSPSYSQSRSTNGSPTSPRTLKETLKTPSIVSQRSETPPEIGSKPGYRAAEAYVRPSPISTVGNVTSYGFDLRNATFTFALDCKAAATEAAPTEIFLPEFHFPPQNTHVEVSSGKWTISVDDADGGIIQRLRWQHGAGKQNMTVKGVQRMQGMASGREEEEGYYEQFSEPQHLVFLIATDRAPSKAYQGRLPQLSRVAMPATRSSARQAAGAAAGSSPSSSQSKEINGAASGSKRKGAPGASPKAKRGKKGDKKEQTTLEETMPQGETQDVEMDDNEEERLEGGEDNDKRAETEKNGADAPKGESNVFTEMMKEDPEDGGKAKENRPSEDSSAKGAPGGSSVPDEDNAVEASSKREHSTPSNILEKGIIYFFERGRVGIDEPSSPDDIARSYIVLRPIPHGSKLGEGPIGDGGNNRLLALPKKVLPKSPRDRFMSFVEKAKVSLDDIKTNFGASDYATKTSGTRHTPPMAPLGEGVYAITSTGRESHLAYILTIPSEISEVQRDIGLQQRGSFITSIKNPTASGPAAANLPQGPGFPQELMDEFHGRRWMPLQPKFLDYANAQILLIGHHEGALEKATDKEPEGEDEGRDKPLEEMEKLEDEDQIRIEHLKGDDSVFVDLGLSSQDYPKVQTTW